MKKIAVCAGFFLLLGLLLPGVAGAVAPNPQPYNLGGGGSWSGSVIQVGAASAVALKLHVATQTGSYFTGTVTIGATVFTGTGYLDGTYINFYGKNPASNQLYFSGYLYWLPGPRIIENSMYYYTSTQTINYGDSLLSPVQ